MASTRARAKARDGAREDMKERCRSKNKRSSLISCASSAMKWDILQMVAPNEEKLKLKKEEERLRHVKCFKCRTWGHLTSMCPTKQVVKQQEEPQSNPQVEQEETPQEKIKINHEDGGDLMMMKKKTRRGGKARHPILIQDAKMMSKT